MFIELHTAKGVLFVCLDKVMFITENKNGCRIFLDDGTQFDCIESCNDVISLVRFSGLNN